MVVTHFVIYFILEWEKDHKELERLIAVRERGEKEGGKKVVEVKRLIELKNKHIAFHNKFPESHRACAICARGGVSKKHRTRDAVYIPPTVSSYEAANLADCKKRYTAPFSSFFLFSLPQNHTKLMAQIPTLLSFLF